MIDTYDWQRYWCPRGASVSVDRDGFLSDPEPLRAYGSFAHNRLRSLSDLQDEGCLVLLGEPGIGKSKTVSQEVARLRSAHSGATILFPSLQTVDATGLRKIFHGRKLRSALHARKFVYLFLDALDECMLRIEVVADLIAEELQQLKHLDMLRLRLICRTAAWPETLETDLRTLWKKRGRDVNVSELVFLRRADVETALVAEEIDPAAFFQYLRSIAAGPFANRPVTLRMVMADMQANSRSRTQRELYDRGIRRLLDETPRERERGVLRRQRDLAARLAIAERLAATTTFTRRPNIAFHGSGHAEQLLSAEFLGEAEQLDGRSIDLSERDIEDVVNSGLFSLAGERQFSFGHRTYAEFLAAQYLVRRNVPVSQVLDLLTGGTGDERIVPELIGVAAWLLEPYPALASPLIRNEAALLVKSDVVLPEEHRYTLVQRVLELASENELPSNFFELPHYERLSHTEIAEQLRRYIEDTTFALRVRYVALDIALYAGVRGLGPTYVQIALDAKEASGFRATAARAVIQLGDLPQRALLKPLVFDAGDRQLRSLAIEATWPDALSVDELLRAFDTPHERNGTMAAEYLPATDILANLRAKDVPKFLAWIDTREARRTEPRYGLRHEEPVEGLVDAVLVAAIAFAKNARIATRVARILDRRLARFDEVVAHDQKPALADALKSSTPRRNILSALIRLASDSVEHQTRIQYMEPPIISSADVPWLIGRLRSGLPDAEAIAYVEMIATYADFPAQLGEIIDAFTDVPGLRQRIEPWLQPVELNTPAAQQLRAQYAEAEYRRKRRLRDPEERPNPASIVLRFLDQFEAGNLDGYWEANLYLSIGPERTRFGDEFERDLRLLPGWEAATAATRARLVRAAEKYVREQQAHTDEWIGTNTYHRPDMAAVRALLLLKNEAPGRLAALPRSVWQTWAPAAVAAPFNGAQLPMIEDYYREAPEEVLRTVAAVMAEESAHHQHIGILSKIDSVWDKRLAETALEFARRTDTAPNALRTILDVALQQQDASARRFAESLLAQVPPAGHPRRDHAVAVAETLLSYTPGSSWPALWNAFTNDRSFGREVVLDLAHRDRHTGKPAERLTDEHLGTLFIWVATEFPSAEDPPHDVGVVYSPTVRDDVATWRDTLLRALQRRGTHTAVAALRSAAATLPSETYLQRLVIEAEQLARSAQWTPLSMPEFLAFIRSSEARLVDSPLQLLTVVEESLLHLAQKLHEHIPAVEFLWNEIPETGGVRWEPKKEERLSDFVAIHLRDDLERRAVVINREVQIRPTSLRGSGERTDIHIDAIRKHGDAHDVVTVIIESKGCWNERVYEDLTEQLADRYLRQSRVAHAVYLVGWYICAAWKKGKVAGKAASNASMRGAGDKLKRRAAKIASQATIRPFVLDARLREPKRLATAASKKGGGVQPRPTSGRKAARKKHG